MLAMIRSTTYLVYSNIIIDGDDPVGLKADGAVGGAGNSRMQMAGGAHRVRVETLGLGPLNY